MAFTFGGSSGGVAPPATPKGGNSTGAFSFGGGSGGTTNAAPATGGFGFGTNSSSGTGGTAASTGGFSFGGAAGTTPAPAPAAGGFAFGGVPAPAAPPATGFSFGAAPAPAAPAPAFGFGAPAATAATAATAAAGQPQQQQVGMVTGYTPYSALPDTAKRAVDEIHRLMMEHRRIMNAVSTMSPAALQDSNTTAADSAPASSLSLKDQLAALRVYSQRLATNVDNCWTDVKNLHANAKRTLDAAYQYGAWPIHNLAARRGVHLSATSTPMPSNASSSTNNPSAAPTNTNTGTTAAELARRFSDMEASTVDTIQRMPSPYLWETIHDLHHRLNQLNNDVQNLHNQLHAVTAAAASAKPKNTTSNFLPSTGPDAAAGSPPSSFRQTISAPHPMRSSHNLDAQEIAHVIRLQHDAFLRVAGLVSKLHDEVEQLRNLYLRMPSASHNHTSVDPFRKADAQELIEKQRVQSQIRAGVARAAATTPTTTTNTPAPGTPSAFGNTTTTGPFGQPQPQQQPPPTSAFGAPAPAAAKPATTGAFGFSSFGASAPAPASTAAAPATGGLFGASAPAPAPAAATPGLFGAPAPAAGGFSFGAKTPAPATPAPAPTPGFGFGGFGTSATAAAPATTPAAPTFGATSTSSTVGSRSKSKSKSSRSRR